MFLIFKLRALRVLGHPTKLGHEILLEVGLSPPINSDRFWTDGTSYFFGQCLPHMASVSYDLGLVSKQKRGNI